MHNNGTITGEKKDMEKKNYKQIYRLMIAAALLVLGVVYFKEVYNWFFMLIGVLTPFFIGGAIAFVLNIPLRMFEEKLFKKWTGKPADKFKRAVSIILSILIVIIIISVIAVAVIPQLGKTIADIGSSVPGFVNDMIDKLIALSVKYPAITEYVTNLDNLNIKWDSIITGAVDFIKNGGANMLSSTVSVASSIFSGVINAVIGVIFAIYILGQKEKIANAFKKLSKAYLKPAHNEMVLKVSALLYTNFSNFITGQCTDALVWGTMIFLGMTILQIPYALLISVLVAFFSLVPILGSFIGCMIGSFLIVAESPIKALIFIIMFIILQQLEGNLIYPKIVGNKVGLPSILVLMAVMTGGSLFGVVGMLVFIPLLSTVYTLVFEHADKKLGSEESKNEN